MKPFLFLFVTVVATAPPARSQQGNGGMRDAATHEQLVTTYQHARRDDPMRNMKPVEASDPSLENQPEGLIKNSDIISFNGMMTLVPKRAILHLPQPLAQRLSAAPDHVIMGWAEFYASNRGWITTVEVSREQAEGKTPLDEALALQISRSSNMVVATYKGGPISVLPARVEEQDNQQTNP